MAHLLPESPALARLGMQESEAYLGAWSCATSSASSARLILLVRLAGVPLTPPPLRIVLAATSKDRALRLLCAALARMALAVVHMLLLVLPADPP